MHCFALPSRFVIIVAVAVVVNLIIVLLLVGRRRSHEMPQRFLSLLTEEKRSEGHKDDLPGGFWSVDQSV